MLAEATPGIEAGEWIVGLVESGQGSMEPLVEGVHAAILRGSGGKPAARPHGRRQDAVDTARWVCFNQVRQSTKG